MYLKDQNQLALNSADNQSTNFQVLNLDGLCQAGASNQYCTVSVRNICRPPAL
jgi:hypothetical protein